MTNQILPGRMSKTFRPWKIDEPLFLPPTVQDFVGPGHLARFVLGLVREAVDLAKITGTYGSERGQPPFDPIMMTALLLYAYCCGIYSSRRIAKACRERVDFMSIVGLDAPDFRTISDFRKVAPGIECKLLATDTERHRVSMLVRLAPGASYPAHTHAGEEELHLLDGELWIDERKLFPGDYNYGAPGAGDERVWSETGCTCVLVTSTKDTLR